MYQSLQPNFHQKPKVFGGSLVAMIGTSIACQSIPYEPGLNAKHLMWIGVFPFHLTSYFHCIEPKIFIIDPWIYYFAFSYLMSQYVVSSIE